MTQSFSWHRRVSAAHLSRLCECTACRTCCRAWKADLPWTHQSVRSGHENCVPRLLPNTCRAVFATAFLLTGTVVSHAAVGLPATGAQTDPFRHVQALQNIATANRGNRAAGTPGYDRSAEYVADQLRAAGYTVRLEEFTFPFFEERSPPVLIAGGGPTCRAAPGGPAHPAELGLRRRDGARPRRRSRPGERTPAAVHERLRARGLRRLQPGASRWCGAGPARSRPRSSMARAAGAAGSSS